MSTPSALLQVMQAAVRKAGKKLARDFGEVSELQVSKKGPADFVSAADTKAEEVLVEELSKARPGYGFLAEERGVVEGTDKTHTWIVDPLNGTTSFLHAIPHFAINIALEREGAIVAAVTYNPATNELFWAELTCSKRRARGPPLTGLPAPSPARGEGCLANRLFLPSPLCGRRWREASDEGASDLGLRPQSHVSSSAPARSLLASAAGRR